MNGIKVQDGVAAVFLVIGIWQAVSAAFGGVWITSMTWFLGSLALTSLWLFVTDIVSTSVAEQGTGSSLNVMGEHVR